MKRKSYFSLLFITMILAAGTVVSVEGVARERTEINIPDVLGYQTLKCDFHLHTVFSDGNVWPPVRVDEAWLQGLDAIAITDHIEYRPHRDDVQGDHDRSYELAKARAEQLSLILVKGSEITRDMPPGHLNAIFLKDSEALDTEDWREALRIAARQGAFIFWNHPGWVKQAPEGVAVWYKEHSELLKEGLLMGLEVANFSSYYPEAYQWAIDKELTVFANSDSHQPISLDFDPCKGEFRPFTLVFASERNEEGIREAILAHRTAAVFQGKIMGASRFLEAIFNRSVSPENQELSIRGQGGTAVMLCNNSDLDFELVNGGGEGIVEVPSSLILKAGKTVPLQLTGLSQSLSGRKTVRVHYEVENLLPGPGKSQPVVLELEVNFIPEE